MFISMYDEWKHTFKRFQNLRILKLHINNVIKENALKCKRSITKNKELHFQI